MLRANHDLANLISDKIGTSWITNLDQLHNIEKYSEDKSFLNEFLKIKNENKQRLAQKVYRATRIMVDPNSMYICLLYTSPSPRD